MKIIIVLHIMRHAIHVKKETNIIVYLVLIPQRLLLMERVVREIVRHAKKKIRLNVLVVWQIIFYFIF